MKLPLRHVFVGVLFVWGLSVLFFLSSNHGGNLLFASIDCQSRLCMPWESGMWSSSSKAAPPSFKEVRDYANAIVWATEPDMAWHSARAKELRNRKLAPLRLLHVINPFSADNRSVASQRMVMASIECARAWIDYVEPAHVHVSVVSIFGDNEGPFMLPATFSRATTTLRKSAMDVLDNEAKRNLTRRRSLPLLKDILRIGHQEAYEKYDYVIFSNADINVMPHFYAVVRAMLQCHKTFFINRVEIPEAQVTNPAQFHLGPTVSNLIPNLPIDLDSIHMAFEYTTKFAQLHPGYDCFVVATDLLDKLVDKVGNVFVGYPPAGSILAEAARSVDRMCVTARRVPATFHVGSRNGEWQGGDAAQYISLNGQLAQNVRKGKPSKCRPTAFKTKGGGISKCYPLRYYPMGAKEGMAMFPEDYAVFLLRRNTTTSSGALRSSNSLLREKISLSLRRRREEKKQVV